jgi:branched-chain amino acid transport system substrate-binding protein
MRQLGGQSADECAGVNDVKNFCRTFLIGLTVLSVSAGSPGGAQEEPYEINAILGLTGSSSFVGQAQQAALGALAASVNADGGIKGRPVHFTVADNQSSPQLTIQLTNAAIAKKAPLLLVSGLLASCKAIEPIVQTNGPVEFCLSQALYPAKDSYVFSAGISTYDLMVTELRYFRARGIRRIASITSNDATGQDADEQLTAVLGLRENKDVTLADVEHFAPGDLSAVAQLEKIKSAKPQMLIVWTTGTPFGTVLRNIRDVGLALPVVTNSGNMSITQMKQYASFVPAELYFPGFGFQANQAASGQGKQAQARFFNALAKANLKPDYLTGIAWDPAMIVIDAVRQLGTNATAAQIRAYILGQRTYGGISGTYDFGDGKQRGLSAKDVVVFRWDAQQATFDAVSGLGGSTLKP